MAMNKAEKARVEELETALALCWPAYPMPQPMTREEIEAAKVEVTPRDRIGKRRVAIGWFSNVHTGAVEQGWSDGHYHSRHNITGDSASQTKGEIYATRRDAAMAMRIRMSRDFAATLAAVDRIINAPTGDPS